MKSFILKNKYLKITIITILTAILFATVSFLALYQTEFSHHAIWSFLGPSDNRFHMMRIDGLYQSMLHHDFFPVINMSFMKGFGYVSNIFYSDFLIYPAALLRLMGYSTAQSLIRYYLMLNFLTFTVSFLCFYKVQKKYWNSLVFSFVYTLGSYRLHDMLFRHDIGELGAFLFLPIAVLGIYEIFYGERKKNWLYLTFGMTGIIYSHAISPVLVAILIVTVACCQVPELKVHPKRLLSLMWAAICSGLLSIGYFLPMLEQLKHTTFLLTETKGILPNGAENLSDYFTWSLNNVIESPNIGLILLLAAILVLFFANKIENKAVKHFAIIGVVLFIVSSKVFPWIILNKTPFKMLQYPWRLDMLVTILLAIFIASDPLKLMNSRTAKIGLILATLLLAVSGSYRLIKVFPGSLVPYSEYNKLTPFSIGGGQEYLPVGTNLDQLQTTSHKPKVTTGKAKISHFKQDGTRLSFDFKKAKNAKVTVPVIAYYGFESKQSTGNVSKLKMNHQNNNLGQVTVNGSGKVVVNYYETTIQKVSRRFSFIALIIIFLAIISNQYDFKKIDWNKLKKITTKE